MTEDTTNPFTLLANETRLGIIEAIGDASGDGEYACLSYSTIKAALGDHDAGNLNYHLRKLRDRFVERTDDGYRLTVPGIRVYQAVSSGQFDGGRPTVPPTEVDGHCEVCREHQHVSYEDGRFESRCLSCEIQYNNYPLSPNAFDPDDPEDLARTALKRAHVDLKHMVGGLCPYCSGQVTHSLSSREETDIGMDELAVYARLSCRSCGWYNHPPIEVVAFHHDTTKVFYERRGVPNHHIRVSTPGTFESTVLATDPWRVEIRTHLNGDTLRHVVDGDLNVVEWAVLD